MYILKIGDRYVAGVRLLGGSVIATDRQVQALRVDDTTADIVRALFAPINELNGARFVRLTPRGSAVAPPATTEPPVYRPHVYVLKTGDQYVGSFGSLVTRQSHALRYDTSQGADIVALDMNTRGTDDPPVRVVRLNLRATVDSVLDPRD